MNDRYYILKYPNHYRLWDTVDNTYVVFGKFEDCYYNPNAMSYKMLITLEQFIACREDSMVEIVLTTNSIDKYYLRDTYPEYYI